MSDVHLCQVRRKDSVRSDYYYSAAEPASDLGLELFAHPVTFHFLSPVQHCLVQAAVLLGCHDLTLGLRVKPGPVLLVLELQEFLRELQLDICGRADLLRVHRLLVDILLLPTGSDPDDLHGPHTVLITDNHVVLVSREKLSVPSQESALPVLPDRLEQLQ